MDTVIKQEVIEKEPREVILTWKERPKEKSKFETETPEFPHFAHSWQQIEILHSLLHIELANVKEGPKNTFLTS
jgi:hypothetical protein